MSLSFFGDKTFVPGDEAVAAALGPCGALWADVKVHAAACGTYSEEWKYYSKAAGWALLLKSGKRTLAYLMPQAGSFKVNLVFGERAAVAAREAGLPPAVLALILEAKPYAEGRSFMVDVTTEAERDMVNQLIDIKHNN